MTRQAPPPSRRWTRPQVVTLAREDFLRVLLDLGTAHARTEIELTQDDLAAFVGATGSR
jgi:hypothetical protein